MYRLLVTALVLSLVPLSGCKGRQESMADPAPFAQAITRYLEKNHMDMEPDRFESLSVEAGTARARVAMRDKAGLYRLRVRWEFTFRKRGEAWEVSKVERGANSR